MRGWRRWTVGSGVMASAVCSTALTAQSTPAGSESDVCSLASSEEFQKAHYPDDPYRRRGLLAVFVDPRIMTVSMDADEGQSVEATRPKLEGLAKLVLPRLK